MTKKSKFQLLEDEVTILSSAINLGTSRFFSLLELVLKDKKIEDYGRWKSTQAGLVRFLSSLKLCTTREEVMELLHGQSGSEDPERKGKVRRSVQEDMAAAEKAWNIGYTGYDNVLNLLDEKLRQNAAGWDPSRMYIPLAAIVQSSGWGKSRLVCQLYEKNMYVLYISCLGKNKSGYPRRTNKLADLLVHEDCNVIALLYSVLKVLNMSSLTCEEWIHSQLGVQEEGSVASRIKALYDKLVVGAEVHAAEPKAERPKDYVKVEEAEVDDISQIRMKLLPRPVPQDDAEDAWAHYYAECSKVYGEVLEPELKVLEAGQNFLLVCLDEAWELGTPAFTRVRRMLKYVPVTACFFCVALGTDRTVADLAASYEDDPSARVRLLSGINQLYEPIWLVGKSDVLTTGPAETTAEHVLQYGRPLWAAYMRSLDRERKHSKVSKVIQLAMKKVLGSEVNLNKPGWVTREIAVAVFACLIGVDVVAWGTLPQELSARHMRTIVKFSDDRKRVYTAAAAEPALASAAAHLLHYNNDRYLREFLSRLHEVCVDGLVLEGVRGEMVIRIILLLAMHEFTKNDNYIKCVPLSSYLRCLFGTKVVEQLEAQNVPLEFWVFFNYFLPTRETPSSQHCKEFYKRNAAVICKRNEVTIDLALPCEPLTPLAEPVRRKNPSRLAKKVYYSVEDVQVASARAGSLGVQVKNHTEYPATEHKLEKAREKLDKEERLNQPMSMLFQVGAAEESITVIDGCVIVKGLCFKCIREDHKPLLRLLATTCEDIFQDVSPEEKLVLEEFIPLSFTKHTKRKLKWKLKRKRQDEEKKNEEKDEEDEEEKEEDDEEDEEDEEKE